MLFAATTTLFDIMTMVDGVMGDFVQLALAVALVVFIWGIVKMMVGMSGGGFMLDADGKKGGSNAAKAIADGKKRMSWGVVALFLIVSIWGIISLLSVMMGVNGAASTQPVPIITMP